MYELLIRYIANCLIENDKSSVKKATKILEKRFAKDTELYKEFRLFNALAKSTVSSTEVAAAILSESKNAARRCNEIKLNKEKSALIKDINYKLNDSKFFYRRIPNYTEYATIQIALNEWRKCDKSNLRKLVLYEEKIISWLMTEKIQLSTIKENQKIDYDSNKLVVKIMTEKLNKKYDSLSNNQKEIIKNYALYSAYDRKKLIEYFNIKKKESLNMLSKFDNINENKFIGQKIKSVREKIELLSTNDIDDKTVVKFLTLTNLLNELREEK